MKRFKNWKSRLKTYQNRKVSSPQLNQGAKRKKRNFKLKEKCWDDGKNEKTNEDNRNIMDKIKTLKENRREGKANVVTRWYWSSHKKSEFRESKNSHKNLHITFIINVSSKAELGNLGLDPSHLSLVESSDGTGRKVNVDITVLAFVEFKIWKGQKWEKVLMFRWWKFQFNN